MGSSNRFPNTQVRFKDTFDAGGITVRGIQLTTDENGFVEGPPSLEEEIAPHGFIREEKWFGTLPSEERVKMAVANAALAGLLNHAEQKALKAATTKAAK